MQNFPRISRLSNPTHRDLMRPAAYPDEYIWGPSANQRKKKDARMVRLFCASYCLGLELPPNHLVHNSRVALDYLDNLR